VSLTMKPVGEPDAGNPHVRFDERGEETEWRSRRHRASPRLYPLLDALRGPPEGRGFTGCGKTRLCRHSQRSLGVRQLAAALARASLLAGNDALGCNPREQARGVESGSPPRRTALQSGLSPRRLSCRSAPALASFSAACEAPPFRTRGEKCGLGVVGRTR
jgi:hypothetical protein